MMVMEFHLVVYQLHLHHQHGRLPKYIARIPYEELIFLVEMDLALIVEIAEQPMVVLVMGLILVITVHPLVLLVQSQHLLPLAVPQEEREEAQAVTGAEE
jgi:hypothetical protein